MLVDGPAMSMSSLCSHVLRHWSLRWHVLLDSKVLFWELVCLRPFGYIACKAVCTLQHDHTWSISWLQHGCQQMARYHWTRSCITHDFMPN